MQLWKLLCRIVSKLSQIGDCSEIKYRGQIIVSLFELPKSTYRTIIVAMLVNWR